MNDIEFVMNDTALIIKYYEFISIYLKVDFRNPEFVIVNVTKLLSRGRCIYVCSVKAKYSVLSVLTWNIEMSKKHSIFQLE